MSFLRNSIPFRRYNSSNGEYRRDMLWGLLFLLPFFAFYGVFNLYPLVQGLVISFFKWNITGAKKFIGLDNYKFLIHDKTFAQSLGNTLRYVLISTPVFMAGSLFMGILVDSKGLRGKTFVRSVLFLPNVLAVSIVAVIWLNVLQPYNGLLNSLLHQAGVEKEVFWLNDEKLVWPSIIMVTFWWNTGYYMLIYLAGLQDISGELYEAASIDGTNFFQRFVYITFPSLKGTHLLVLFLQVIASFKIFGQVFLITGGGPGGLSRTLIQFIYEVGFTTFQVGQASAASFALLLIILLVSIIQIKIMNRVKE
jgi:multiple sugar transport system permease protein